MSLHSSSSLRQIVLDTETTGMNEFGSVNEGHYIIEVAALELIYRQPQRTFQRYIRAPIPPTPASIAVHGITEAFLQDKPTFAEVAEELADFLRGAELIIHNAPFDVSFLKAEFNRYYSEHALDSPTFQLESSCRILDTLKIARQKFPGRRNSLDALCQRYGIDRSERNLHGALIDVDLLMQVYLAMTSTQTTLVFETKSPEEQETRLAAEQDLRPMPPPASFLETQPDKEAESQHEKLLDLMRTHYTVPLYDAWAPPSP